MIKILIADDHLLIREGLKKVLKEAIDMKVVKEAVNAAEMLAILKEGEIDLVILDISLPDKSGLEVLQDLRRDYPKLPVLILSAHPEERFAVRALREGAAGYLTKESAPQELIQALRKIVQGRKYVSPSLAERLAIDIKNPAMKPPHETLSSREYQILRLVAGGKSSKEIAADLSISVNTVNTYRARMQEKMGMKTDAELIRYALENHLID
jgi:two-component system, NarL family, invasion response regulator UvrY